MALPSDGRAIGRPFKQSGRRRASRASGRLVPSRARPTRSA